MNAVPNRFENISTTRKAIIISAVVVISLIILFALAESAVRVRQLIKHGTAAAGVEQLYEYNEELGLRIPVPNFESARISIDAHGFRNPPLETPKPAGRIRLAFLGASAVFGSDLPNDEATWPHKITEQLRAHYPQHSFDYINATAPGYTAKSNLKSLERRVAQHEPDIVVIYTGGNDLTGNTRAEARKNGWQGSFGDAQLSWAANYSTLIYLVEKNLIILATQQEARAEKRRIELSTAAVAEPFRESLIPLVRKAQEIADQVVLVTLSYRIRPEHDQAERESAGVTTLYYMPFLSLQGIIDHVAAYNQTITEVGRLTGAIVIGGEHDIPGTEAYFLDSVHLTERGSARMAKRIADALIEADIVLKVPETNR